MKAPRRPYVYALDWLRAITILGVVAVHGVRLSLQHVDPAPEGAIQMLLQFGREGFMVMTGFVLTYQYASGRSNWFTFWKRRYQNVVFPYLLWVLVFLVLEVGVNPAGGLLGNYISAVETGNGHLYYLLITMQMYLVTPLMIWLVRRLSAYGWVLVAGSVLLEFMLWSLPAYQNGPSILDALGLWTYVGFYILGGAIGYHWSSIEGWVREHRRGFVAAWALAAIGTVPIYLAMDAGQGVVSATNVFQPVSVVYTLAAVACILALGTWYADWRVRGGRLATLVFLLSEYSFAMYLVHPMFLDAWLWLTARLALNPWFNTVLVVVIGWAASLAASVLLRRLPGSPYIIGMSRAAHALPRPSAAKPVALRSTS